MAPLPLPGPRWPSDQGAGSRCSASAMPVTGSLQALQSPHWLGPSEVSLVDKYSLGEEKDVALFPTMHSLVGNGVYRQAKACAHVWERNERVLKTSAGTEVRLPRSSAAWSPALDSPQAAQCKRTRAWQAPHETLQASRLRATQGQALRVDRQHRSAVLDKAHLSRLCHSGDPYPNQKTRGQTPS